MAIAEIEEWLNGSRDYSTGIILFLKHGTNTFLKKTLPKGPSAYNVPKLAAELQAIHYAQPAGKPRFKIESRRHYNSLPDEIKAMQEEKGTLHKEMSYLHSRLTEMPRKEREAADFRILFLDKQLRAIWKKLDYYEEHKTLPEEVKIEVKELSPAAAVKRRNNLRTYISRDPDNPKADAWKGEIDELIKIIEP